MQHWSRLKEKLYANLSCRPLWKHGLIEALTWLALAAVVVVQCLPFTYGYRPTADDVGFLSAWTDRWSSLADWSVSLAVVQGRLGMLSMMPLNTLGSYFSDTYVIRLGFVLLHFGVFALFAVFVSLVTSTRLFRPLLLLLAILQPIGQAHDHMPPVAYPLQNTLPFLALLGARCMILLAGRGRAIMVVARIIFLVALFTNEYALLFGSTLLVGEYAAAWTRHRHVGATARSTTIAIVCDQKFLSDASSVSLVLTGYLVFRWLFPSSYEGNVLDGAFHIGRVIETVVRHVHAGTVFSRDFLGVSSLPEQAIPLAVVVGLLTAACMLVVLWDVSLPSPGLTALVCVFAIVFVTFPLAANVKQQVWCVDKGACGYLDSRISYLGFTVLILCAITVLLRKLPSHRARTTAIAGLSIAFGLIAATTYAGNVRDGLPMSIAAKVWQRANIFACHPDLQPANDRQLVKTINPEGRVRFGPEADQAQFWRSYFKMAAGHWRCGAEAAIRQADMALLEETTAVLRAGQSVRFDDSAATRYLDKGWSQPEPYGVWTDDKQGSISFVLGAASNPSALSLSVVFRPYIRPARDDQRIEVLVNGSQVSTWIITRRMNEGDCCQRSIRLPQVGVNEEVEISFRVGYPRVPEVDGELVDSRHLGLFLHAVSLTRID